MSECVVVRRHAWKKLCGDWFGVVRVDTCADCSALRVVFPATGGFPEKVVYYIQEREGA